MISTHNRYQYENACIDLEISGDDAVRIDGDDTLQQLILFAIRYHLRNYRGVAAWFDNTHWIDHPNAGILLIEIPCPEDSPDERIVLQQGIVGVVKSVLSL